MSDWQTQVDKLPEDYEGITRERYASGLAAFRAWYLQSYSDEPDATLLTDDEVRDYCVYLTGVKGYKAATINAYLALIRATVRAQGRTLKVKGVTPQVRLPPQRRVQVSKAGGLRQTPPRPQRRPPDVSPNTPWHVPDPPHRCKGYSELQRRFTLRATGGSER